MKTTKQCKLDGCPGRADSKGFCAKHYGRWKTHGDPIVYRKFQHRSPKERFWMKVQKGTTFECWEWKESNRRGYGCLWVSGKYVPAHRFSWQIHYGEIPKGICVLHKCDNPLCVNPPHLFLGTHADNARDKIKKNRGANGIKTNSRGRLTSQEVKFIRKEVANKTMTQRAIAKTLNVGNSCINAVVRGRTYAYYN